MEENKKETKQEQTTEEKNVEVKKVEKQVEDKNVTEEKKTSEPKETKKPVDKKTTEEKKSVDKKENKEVESKNKNNKSVIMIVILAILAIAVVLAGIFLKSESPKKVLENTLNELKLGAYAQNMLSGLLEGEDDFNIEAQKLFFEKLEWKILEVNEEEEKATIEVEITNKDFKAIIANYMQKALKAAFSGQNITEEEMTNYLMEELRNEEVKTVTNKNSISLEKQDGKWEIVEEDNFVNAVLPGLYEAMNSFDQE